MALDQEKLKVARNYATALFQEVSDAELDDCSRILCDLACLYSEHSVLHEALQNPTYSREQRGAVLAEIFSRRAKTASSGLRSMLNNFALLLLEHDRVGLLEEISKSFSDQLDALKRKSRVRVSTAFELSDEEKQQLRDSLQLEGRRSVEVTFSVEPDLLGGVLLETGGRIYDSSVRGRLQKLRTELRA